MNFDFHRRRYRNLLREWGHKISERGGEKEEGGVAQGRVKGRWEREGIRKGTCLYECTVRVWGKGRMGS